MATDPLARIQAQLREQDARPPKQQPPLLRCDALVEMLDLVPKVRNHVLAQVADYLASLQAHERMYAHEIIRRTLETQ